MGEHRSPPFRAEHIGSLLRPPALKQALAAHGRGELSHADLHALEDRLILDAIALQESVGLQSVTDGEFRRSIYFGHFPQAVAGFTDMEAELDFQDANGQRMRYQTPVVTGTLRRERGIATEEFRYVRAHTRATPKVTLPSPCSQHYFRWREGISDRVYPDLELFFADVARVYREELAALADLGATVVQLDDVSLPLLCDARLRAGVQARGYDPDALVDTYVAANNAALRERPPGLRVGMHLCRGNNQGKWLGEGGYEAIAEKLFTGLEIDFFCLEYDGPRAGSFEPLRFMPADKSVVLGLVSSKTPVLESVDELCRRIEEAGRYVPLERLCLSPQCGFASTAPGNPLTAADQRRKLERVVEVARRTWGTA
ncbi:MAG: 5-methyltetrahydropteroyltriglutamate--homocysteine S-methyltransferase [Gammaproteobacteria bacterium]|nr:5-methyltetrahydropteroyltriglutamate--homocysteine S-methyltransferase [Gammaproteobacteria bacterium]